MAKTVKISSTTWKQIDDMLRGGGIDVGFSLGGGQPQLSYAVARNDGGVNIAQYDVVSITGILVTSQNAAFYECKYGFSVTDTLSNPDKPYGVALEPIVVGAFGRIAVFGHVAVRVNMTDASHEFAAPSATVAGQLDSASSGPFRLIWTYATSLPVFVAGLTWGVAIFPYATGSGGGQIQKAYCKSDAGTGTTIECFLNNGNYTEYDDTAAYLPGDYVWNASGSYKCILGCTGISPPNATYWVPTTDLVTVHCSISHGTDMVENLNSAIPRLEAGSMILVWFDGTNWLALTKFQATEVCPY